MVTLTESAATKVKDLLTDKADDIALRVFIKSGGCSGFSYGMALDRAKEDDRIFVENGVKILIDSNSMNYLGGAQIDYVDSMMGAGFKINNPNATSTCGCGSSFRTSNDGGKPGSCSV